MEDDVIFIKQVSVHPRDRLARATNEKGEVIFVRLVKEKTKTLKYPRFRLNTKELQVAKENVSAIMEGNLALIQKMF